ncbi:MAG: hypothetical protein ACRDF5_12245 [bacterium]
MRVLPASALLVLALLAALSLAGCSSQSGRPAPEAAPAKPVQVEVEGTPGVRFEGTLGELPEARTITGVVPASFSLEMRRAVFVRVQKAAPEGTLTVRLLVNGTEVASAATTKPFGLVAITYPTKPRAR